MEAALAAVVGLTWVRGDTLGLPSSAKEGEVVLDKDQVPPRDVPESKLRYTLSYAIKAAADGSHKAEPSDTGGVV